MYKKPGDVKVGDLFEYYSKGQEGMMLFGGALVAVGIPLLGWWWNGRILKRRSFGRWQLWLFDALVPLWKRVDNAIQTFIQDYADGSVKGGTDITNDLKSGGVGLSTSGGYIDDIKTQLDDFQSKIVNGDITVPTTP